MDVQYQRSTQYSIAQRSLSRSAWQGMDKKLIQRLGGDSLYPCVLGHEFSRKKGGCGGPFPHFLLHAEKLRDWTRKPCWNYFYPGVRKTRATPHMCLFGSSVWYHASRSIAEHCEWQENQTACRTHFHMKGFAVKLVLKQRHKSSSCLFLLFKIQDGDFILMIYEGQP